MSLFNEDLFAQFFSPPSSRASFPAVFGPLSVTGQIGPTGPAPIRPSESPTETIPYGQPVFDRVQPATISGNDPPEETPLLSSNLRSQLLQIESRPAIAIREGVKDLRYMYKNVKAISELATATMTWLDNDIRQNVRRPAVLLYNEIDRLEKLVSEMKEKLGRKIYRETAIDEVD